MSSYIDKTTLAEVIGTVFDTVSVKPLRPKYIFDSLCREKEWKLASLPSKGDKITFSLLGKYDANTAELSTTATTMSGSNTSSYTRRSVSLTPRGDHLMLDTLESKQETFIDDVGDAAWSLADQAANSINLLARDALDKNMYRDEVSGTIYSTGHMYGSYTNTLGPIDAKTVRKVVARLRANKVKPYPDGFYRAAITETQYTQLRSDSDNSSWTKTAQYADAAPLLAGEVGIFEGVRFMLSTENKIDGSTVSAYFLGQDACGRGVGSDVKVSTGKILYGPQQNLMLMNWNALLGYKVIRREALVIVSSTNTTL